MTMNDNDTHQISETLKNECIINTEKRSTVPDEKQTEKCHFPNIAAKQSAVPDEKQTEKCYRPKASALPTSFVRTIEIEYDDGDDDDEITAIPTTIILHMFSDRTFLSITQISGKMGSLLMCNVEESIIDNSTTYHVSTLLGTGTARSSGDAERDVALREVCARRLAERMVRHARRMAGVREATILGGGEDATGPIPPLVLGLGLRPSKDGRGMGVERFNTMVDAAVELYEDGWRICHSASMVGPD